tara:strand:+ start:7502 stop:7723 length:222 start_codon:yes stop_codon:yes gene_type:complete
MTPSDTDTGDVQALFDWLDQFQGFRPQSVDLADPAGASRAAAKAGREAAQDLPFDADPTGFTRLLESLARKDA